MIETKRRRSIAVTALSATLLAAGIVTAAVQAQGAQTTLDVWIYDSLAGAPTQALIANFQKANPRIKVNLIPTPPSSSAFRDKFIVAAQAGAGPDVIMSDIAWSPQFAAIGIAKPIDDLVTPATLKAFYPGALQTLQYKGKTYGLPFYTNALGMAVNKDAFKAAGLKVPTGNWSWKDFMTAVDKLSNGKMYGFGYEGGWGGTYEWMPWVWQNGGALLNADNTKAEFASKEGLEATQAFLGLVTNKKYVPEAAKTWKSWDELATAFATGTIAMYEVGDWGISGITRLNPKFDWGFVPLPSSKTSASIVGGANWMINANTKKTDAAVTFLKYVTGPASYTLLDGFNRMSARRGSETSQSIVVKDPRMQVFAKILKTAKARPSLPNWTQIEYDCLQPAFLNVILKGADVKDQMTTADTCANKILAAK